MKKTTKLSVFILILFSVFFASCQEKATLFHLNLEQGKEYKQKTSTKSIITQSLNGQQMSINMTIGGSMSYLVTSIVDEAYHMDVKYESISMTMQMPQGMNIEFSSEKDDPNDIFSSMFKLMVGQAFQVIMARDGKVLEVNNIDILFDSAISLFDGYEMEESQKEQVIAQISNAYGDKAFKGLIESVTAVFSDIPVKKGDKWRIDTRLESGMSANMSSEYELVEQTADYILIKGNSTIETDDKEAYIPIGGTPTKYDLEGSKSSEIKIDKHTGWIIEAKTEDILSGEAHIKENEQLPNGLTIPVTMINKTTITN